MNAHLLFLQAQIQSKRMQYAQIGPLIYVSNIASTQINYMTQLCIV